LAKNQILVIKSKFSQKSKFWSQFAILVKNQHFCKKKSNFAKQNQILATDQNFGKIKL